MLQELQPIAQRGLTRIQTDRLSRTAIRPGTSPPPFTDRTVHFRPNLLQIPIEECSHYLIENPVARSQSVELENSPGQKQQVVQPMWKALFSSCYPTAPQEIPDFPDSYGPDQIKQEIESYRLLSGYEDDDWMKDTTCSTTAKRVSEALGIGTGTGEQRGAKKLAEYMQTEGITATYGKVFRIKIGQEGMSQHEFVIEQRGNTCYLIQAWLDIITLEQWLSCEKASVRKSVVRLGLELNALETSFLEQQPNELRDALATTFGVEYSDKAWEKERRVHWGMGFPSPLSWEAWDRKPLE